MTDALPAVLREIASLAGVGQGKALQLAGEFGGTRIYIPSHASDRHPLVKCVGRDAADAICKHFSVDRRRGQRVEIPIVAGNYNQVIRAIRKSVEQLDGDASSAQIALRAGITQRTVHRHRSRKRDQAKPSKQGRLF